MDKKNTTFLVIIQTNYLHARTHIKIEQDSTKLGENKIEI